MTKPQRSIPEVPDVPEVHIRYTYRLELEFDSGDRIFYRRRMVDLDTAIMAIEKTYGVRIVSNTGGAAHFPYFEVSAEHLDSLKAAVKDFVGRLATIRSARFLHEPYRSWLQDLRS